MVAGAAAGGSAGSAGALGELGAKNPMVLLLGKLLNHFTIYPFDLQAS